jgi:hypothetical protein|tara:strand:- start:469 stop:1410 length:942 start_codon:yes stop_codon:yes gene_type:complete
MSGRDVRRLAARASNMTHEAKRDIVARIAAGADSTGVSDIYVMREPFRIAELALEHMPLSANVHILDAPIKNDSRDTQEAIHRFIEMGCRTIVSLGGDGTNRAIVKSTSEIDLIPLSTGTNNVFPLSVEPTLAGIVAGLNAVGKITDDSLKSRSKVIYIESAGIQDIALIDLVLLSNDQLGSLLPFKADNIRKLLLTRAEPASIGMSPIGGFIDPVYEDDDEGLLVDLSSGGRTFRAPLSPGLFGQVNVSSAERIKMDTRVVFEGPGVLAMDGDREIQLMSGQTASVSIRRDGPFVLKVDKAMRWAASNGIIS